MYKELSPTKQQLSRELSPLHIVTRECPDHGVQQMPMGQCPKCAEEIANGGAVRSIQYMMAASLEALAERLR